MADARELFEALRYLADNFSPYAEEINLLLDGDVETWQEALDYWFEDDEDDDYYEDDEDGEYVVHRLDTDIEEIAYWSNRFGWVDIGSATVYTKYESETLNLPVDVKCEWMMM